MQFIKGNLPLKSLFASAMCIFLFSCGSQTTPVEPEAPAPAKDSAAAKNKVQKEETPSYTLPSPLQIASIFKKSGLKYYPNIANPFENASKYNAGKINQALNLGVYS